MKLGVRALLFALCGLVMASMCGFSPDPAQKVGADIIVTAAPVYVPRAELRGAERFPKGAQLLLVHDGKAESLVPDFAASADANVSFDGEMVLFAGKQKAEDPWQIWEVNLKDRKVRRVLTTATDAERPFYLPVGRMVYALRTPQGFRVQSDDDGHPPRYQPMDPVAGPGPVQISFTRSSAFPADVMRDGRILFETGYPMGTGSIPEMYLVYPDGSGIESYRCDHGLPRWGGEQLTSGDVVFTQGQALARFTSPLAHEERVTAPQAEYAGAIAETSSGAWLVSARAAACERYSIRLWKPGAVAMETVIAEKGEDLVEPVLVVPRTTPKRFPTALHPWSYANLLALDARLTREGELQGTPATVRLEAQDANGRTVVMGTAPVEKDGSFFVQVPGDTPIRFALLDAHGTVLRQQHGWFWARAGEQRICVGCHTGPERSSDNRLPEVLEHTTTPVDLTHARATDTAHAGSR